jgi:hypothetical protein
MDNFVNRHAQASEVSITLDSVIFRDNTFVGPDHAGHSTKKTANAASSVN